MPDSDALINAEDGKRVTITIAELTEADLTRTATTDVVEDLGEFIITSGKYRLTITIAE
jgi:hypothetical protein